MYNQILKTELGQELKVSYSLAKLENAFGITLKQENEERTEFFTESELEATKVLNILASNGVTITTLGDCLDDLQT